MGSYEHMIKKKCKKLIEIFYNSHNSDFFSRQLQIKILQILTFFFSELRDIKLAYV